MPAKKSKLQLRGAKQISPPQASEYPKVTDGSKWAAEIREEANSLTEKQKSDLFRQGMQIVYGGARKQKARARH